MTTKNILLIQGHPDTIEPHLCHALADAYAEGARQSGHDVRTVHVAALDFPMLRSQHAWEEAELPPALRPAQQDLLWAGHIVLFFPLWLGARQLAVHAKATQGPLGSDRRHHGHARARLSVVLPCPQCQVA